MSNTLQSQLSEIQKQLKAPKNQFNKFGGYKYRSCEDILEAVKPLLGDLSLTISDEIVHFTSNNPAVSVEEKDLKGHSRTRAVNEDRYYVKAIATITDGDDKISVSAFAREELNKKGMDGSQITGAASSYARKYALNGLLLIDDTKDADSGENKAKVKAPAPKKAAVKAPAPTKTETPKEDPIMEATESHPLPWEGKEPSSDWLKDDLVKYATEKGLEITSSMTKQDILDAINNAGDKPNPEQEDKRRMNALKWAGKLVETGKLELPEGRVLEDYGTEELVQFVKSYKEAAKK